MVTGQHPLERKIYFDPLFHENGSINTVLTGRGSSVSSMSGSQVMVLRSILAAGTFLCGKIISLFFFRKMVRILLRMYF